MLVGGMFDIDVEKGLREVPERDFPIRCDVNGRYLRKKMTNNGRTATTYAFSHGLRIAPGKKILAPEYMCVSCVNAFEAADLPFVIYKVKEGLEIDLEDLEAKMNEEIGAIYLIHYFGFPQSQQVVDKIQELAARYQVPVVEDLTQTLLSKVPGRMGFADYLVSSVRKWFPVTDGGIVAAREDAAWEDVPLKDAYDEAVYTQMFLSLARQWYGQQEYLKDAGYLDMEKRANSKRYFDFEAREMTGITKSILAQCDLEEAMAKRRANYTYLYQHLKDVDGLKILMPELDKAGDIVPFGFQVIVEQRDAFFAYMREHKVIGEIQWPLPLQYYQPSEYAQYLSDHSLMFHVDQRYGETEMNYIVTTIQSFFTQGDNCPVR